MRLWLFALIIIAAYIRVSGGGGYYYNQDELMHINIASGKSLEQLFQFSLYEMHPPLAHFIRHYWLMISDEIWFVRGLSLLFGLALIPLYYLIGKRLNGDLTGVCAAFLAAFSGALITQSYIVRNYTIFVFFLSAAFYYYLKWRDNAQRNQSLILYFIFSVLACLTHFSGILAIFVIASCESIRLFLQRDDKLSLAKWGATNIIIAVIFLAIYHMWLPTIDASSIAVIANQPITFERIFYLLISYPIFIPAYVTLGNFFIISTMSLIPLILRNNKNFIGYLYISAFAILLGTILAIARFYEQGLRHSLWIFPFVIIIAAWVMADFYKLIEKKHIGQRILASFLIFVGVVIYNPQERFSDLAEYTMPIKDWREITSYMKQFGENTVVILHKDDAVFFGNTYEYFDKDFPSGAISTKIMPYNDVNVLFNEYYSWIHKKETFFNIINSANEQKFFEGKNSIMFVATIWTIGITPTAQIPLLFVCPELDKKIVAFPPLKPNEIITKENIYGHTALFMTVSKKDFFEQVISPTGKANACLDRKLR